MNEAIQQIHNAAMDLSDLAHIKKLKDGDAIYQHYMKAAYELELYAALKIEANTDKNDQLWRANLLKSAGWLAYKCGYFNQAKRLANIGLEIPTDGYTLSKLENLKATVEEKISINNTSFNKISALNFHGFLSAADMETNEIILIIKEDNTHFSFFVPEEKMQQVAQLFLGTTVEIDAKQLEDGKVMLEDIRWAA